MPHEVDIDSDFEWALIDLVVRGIKMRTGREESGVGKITPVNCRARDRVATKDGKRKDRRLSSRNIHLSNLLGLWNGGRVMGLARMSCAYAANRKYLLSI